MTHSAPRAMGGRLTVLLVAVAAVIGLSAPPAASDGGAKNVVRAFNEADGTHLARSGVQVAPVAGPTVEPENLAYAKSSCVNCRTVAVAVQAVMITSDADVVSPKNLALAVNSDCTSCATGAFVYQYVVTTDGPVHLTTEGQQRIADLRQRIAAVTASGLSFPELEARLDVLFHELQSVVDQEVVKAGRTGSGMPDKGVDTEAA